jgi:hypothetical protein
MALDRYGVVQAAMTATIKCRQLALISTIAELTGLSDEGGATRAIDGFTVVRSTLLPPASAADSARVRG